MTVPLRRVNIGNTQLNTTSETGDPPFYVSLLLSWLPLIVMVVFYILFLKIFKQMVRIGERIAITLEKRVDNQKSKIEEL